MPADLGPVNDLGPCEAVFKDRTLGDTFGGVNFRTSQSTADVRTDAMGVTAVDKIFIGETCEAEVHLTRTQLVTLAKILAGASGSGTTGNQMVMRSVVGRSQVENSGTLVLKPYKDGVPTTDARKWLTIFIAASRHELDLAFDHETQRVYTVFFTGFPVMTNGDPAGTKKGWLWKIGTI